MRSYLLRLTLLHIYMKDPLRDNRIFPEEMHQKSLPTEKNPNLSLLWVVIGILLLALLGWYIYSMNKSDSSENPSFQEQEAAFNEVKDASPILSEEERETQVDFFFNGENI